MHKKTSISFLLLFLISFTSMAAHSDAPWTDVLAKNLEKASSSMSLLPDHYRTLRLDEKAMRSRLSKNNLSKNNLSNNSTAIGKLPSVTQIEVPLPDGSFLPLQVTPGKTMAPELAAKYPQIRTYQVDGHLNDGIYGVLDITSQGFHAMLFMRDGTRLFIDPRQSTQEKLYISYFDKNYHPADKEPHICNITEHQQVKGKQTELPKATPQQRTGTSLKTYRMAVATTGEYTAFHGGAIGALSAMTTSISRVNVIFARDLATRLELIANTDLLIRTDTTTYSNLNSVAMLAENQTQVDSIIGAANYDIGHVLTTGGGGVAYVGATCNNVVKAGGVTGSRSPVSDTFDINILAHEIGHQFNSRHTFNSLSGSCNGNRTASSAFEPGSGSTIMAYAGICSENNLQANADAMYHIKSIQTMGSFINNSSTGGSCGTDSPLNNQQPTANAGINYIIPANTPFELTGIGSDPDGDTLSYTWEQIDLGQSSDANQDTGDNPIFRTFLPVSVPTRVFPKLTDILSNTSTIGELLPSTARTLSFSLGVRDNQGGVANDEIVASVAASTGFKVTSHNTSQTLSVTNTVVTWDVAGTASSPVNCSHVDISLSTDGGTTFTSVSAESTANDGSEGVTLPFGNSTAARFKVKCADNIFFDISDVDLILSIEELVVLSPVLSNIGANNLVDPGETIDIVIPLVNQTPSTLTNVSGTLSSSVTDTSIPTPNSDYPDIPGDNQANNTTAFQLQVPISHVCGTNFPISLVTTSDATPPTKQFELTIPTGSPFFTSQTNSTSQAIPGGVFAAAANTTSIINISGVGVFTSPVITIDVDITHPFRGDTEIQLTSPQGTSVQLKAASINDPFDNIIGNFPTTLTPVGSLSAFDGENLDGNWTLTVGNFSFGAVGTLNSWSLNLQTFICDDFDTDEDTVLNAEDNCPNTPNTDQLNTDNDVHGDVCDDDDDNDGITDVWEIQFGFDPLDPADAALDADSDGSSNLQEFQSGTDPNTPLTALSPILSNTGDDSVVDPGETINIIIPLSNQSPSTLTNISGTLSSSTAGTSIPTPASAYPNIAIDSQANNTTAYQVHVPTSHLCGADLPVTLTTAFTTATNTNFPSKQFEFNIPIGNFVSISELNSSSQAIPDGGFDSFITSIINISGAGVTIASSVITIDVDITHAYRGDIGIQLTSPQGTSVQLKASDFNDTSDNIIGNFPTTLTPVDSLSAFDGENLDGNWTLTVADDFFLETGTLNSWTLNYQASVCQHFDIDGDTVLNAEDNCPNTANTDQLNTDNDADGDVCDTDDDNDGITDVWEIQFGFDPLDPTDAALDPDNDGITNLQEFQAGSNPNVFNTPAANSIVPIINDLLL